MTTYVNPNAIKEHSVTSAHLADGVIPTDASIAAMGYTKNQGTITGITMNGESQGTAGVVNLGTVVTDVSNLAPKSDAIASLSLSMNSTNYQITLSGTKVDGTAFTVQDTIDLPIESVVVSGAYDNNTKKVVLTLKNGTTIDFSVADLVAGLQTEITSSNKLSADLISDGNTNKTVTATEKSTWNGKQDAISDLATIRANASEGAAKVSNVQADWNATTGLAVVLHKPTIPSEVTESTVSGWGFTKNAGTLTGVKFNNADAAVSNGVASITATIPAAPGTLKSNNTSAQTTSASESLSGTINLHKVAKTGTYSDLIGIPTIPTVNNSTITIKKNGTSVGTFTTNAASNTSINVSVNELPAVTSADNGKVLQVVNGAWSMVTPVSIYSGSGTPDNTQGANGDIYLQV